MANGVKYSSNVQIEIVHKVLQTSESLYSTVHTTISCDVMQFAILTCTICHLDNHSEID